MAPPKRPWFRMYVEVFTDMDVRAMPVAQRWVWAALMGLARSSPVAGAVLDSTGEPVTEAVIADFAAVRPVELRAALRRFAALGWTEKVDGVLTLTKWDRRQFESDDVTARTAKHRAMKRPWNADGTAVGTFHAPDHGTESLSVGSSQEVPTEIQRAEPESPTPPTTSSAAPEPGGDGIEATLTEAARLLAQAEADRRGNEIGNPAGYVRSRTPAIRKDHEDEWRRLLEREPSTTAQQLADPATTEDRASAAARAIYELNARQRAGDVCPTCEKPPGTSGMVETEHGYAPCPVCRTREYRALGEAS